MPIALRPETPADYYIVEEMTREAFWNLHVPGCDEHFLLHQIRSHPDYLPELSQVAVQDGLIVGAISYTRSQVHSSDGHTLNTLTFGPVCVRKSLQHTGIGGLLIRSTLAQGTALGYSAIVIEGFPKNYCCYGFRGSDAFAVADSQGNYPFGLLVQELHPGALAGRRWRYAPSPAYSLDLTGLADYDRQFPPLEKRTTYSQEEYRIALKATLRS